MKKFWLVTSLQDYKFENKPYYDGGDEEAATWIYPTKKEAIEGAKGLADLFPNTEYIVCELLGVVKQAKIPTVFVAVKK